MREVWGRRIDVDTWLKDKYLHVEEMGLSYLDRGSSCTFEESVKRVRDPKRYARVRLCP